MFSTTTLCIILSSLTGYTVIYYLLNVFLVKWMLKAILGERINIIHSRGSGSESVHEVHTSSQQLLADRKSSHNGIENSDLVEINDGHVSKIANLTISVFIAIVTAVVAFLVMWETRYDVVFAKSTILVPYAHFSAWYFIPDTFTWYKACIIRKNLTHLPLLKRILMFIKLERAIIIHHLLVFGVGYPIAINYSVRRDMGDFMIGAFMAQELSNPFQSMAMILRMLKQQKSMVYFLNGVILIPTYFIVRILNLPLVFILFAAQHHNWNVWTAVRAMYPICHIFNLVQFSLQIVWFSAIVRIAMKAGMLRLPWSKRSVSYASRVSKVD